MKRPVVEQYLEAHRRQFNGDALINIGIELAKRFPDGDVPEYFRNPNHKFNHPGFLQRLRFRFFPPAKPKRWANNGSWVS